MMDLQERLMTKVAMLYYEENLTQQEIAMRLRISRSRVSRLLAQARKNGIVRTVIIPPSDNDLVQLEREIESKYGVEDCMIVPVNDSPAQETLLRALGSAGAKYLASVVHDGVSIGVSWGRTLAALASACPMTPRRDVRVIQLVGGLGAPELDTHATAIARQMAYRLAAKPILLPAPGIVASEAAKTALLNEPQISDVFSWFTRLDIAFVGIGNLHPSSILVSQGNILTNHDIKVLKSAGVVGDIALRFFNDSGRFVQTEVDKRVLGIEPDALRQIRTVIGVAGGREKVETLKAALKGRLVDVLITDSNTARLLLI